MFYERRIFDWALNSLLNKVFCISWDNETTTMSLSAISLRAERLPIYKIVALNRISQAFSIPGKEQRMLAGKEKGRFVTEICGLAHLKEYEISSIPTWQHWKEKGPPQGQQELVQHPSMTPAFWLFTPSTTASQAKRMKNSTVQHNPIIAQGDFTSSYNRSAFWDLGSIKISSLRKHIFYCLGAVGGGF